MNCKSFWCTLFGHNWGSKVRIELDLPAFGRGFVIHESCSRCGKERTSLDFKVNKTNIKQNSGALLPVSAEAFDATTKKEEVPMCASTGDCVRFLGNPAEESTAPKKARAKKPAKSDKD